MYAAVTAAAAVSALAVNPGCFPNCLAQTPPMGWRSWNAFGSLTDQTMLTQQIDALVARKFSINGKPTSLWDLGYVRVGEDDGWEACGTGVNGSFHDASGVALVNASKFPDMKGLVDYAHSKGVLFDFYRNNDGCCEYGKVGPYYAEDAAQSLAWGLDGLKFDNCGPGHNMTQWADVMNATGRSILIENCNDNEPFRPTVNPDGTLDCPYNMYRTGIDNAPNYLSMVANLMDLQPFLTTSVPGCWAYPDMLEVGAPAAFITIKCPNASRLSFTEAQTEFSAWSVVSSPLILGFDLSNETEYDTWWPIVSNTEAIAVNQAWAGSAGRLVAASPDSFSGPVGRGYTCEVYQNVTLPLWTVWAKPLPGGATAAVAINTMDDRNATFRVPTELFGFPTGATLAVRDVNAHANLQPITGSWDLNLGPRGSQFVVLSKS